MITKEKMPRCFFKLSQLILKGNVCRDQFGEFVCGYWGLKVYLIYSALIMSI